LDRRPFSVQEKIPSGQSNKLEIDKLGLKVKALKGAFLGRQEVYLNHPRSEGPTGCAF
jgi:hypothetical protein